MGITKKLGPVTLSLGLLTAVAGGAQAASTTTPSGSAEMQQPGSTTPRPKPGSSNTQPGSHSNTKHNSTQQQQQSNQDLVQALEQLHSAEKTLRGDDHDYGGHRVAAMHDIHEAEHELREALKDSHHGQSQGGGKSAGTSGGKQTGASGTKSGGNSSKYATTSRSKSEPLSQQASNQQLGNTVTALKQVVSTLHQAKHDYGGHREQAVRHIERAIHQLEEGLHYAKEHDQQNG